MNQLYDAYVDIIPEKSSWHSVCVQRLPTTFWVNTLKVNPNVFLKTFGETHDLTPISWHPAAFRTSQPSFGKTWQYSAGLLQIQEEVSMLPVHFLNPQPGERVLDLCAAPGNKSAQVSIALKNTGTVVANDRNFHRMRAFGQIAKRLGLMNVSTTIYDGRHFPRDPNYFFDKVLVDAPCSGEGTFRKGKGRDMPRIEKNSLRLHRIQIDLLRKAVALCRPGGRIVYSTCTFAPEENEAVIDALLKEHPELILEPLVLDNFNLTPGVLEWQGVQFHPSVARSVRVWPHLNNTGGFFIAMIRKPDVSALKNDEIIKTDTPRVITSREQHLHETIIQPMQTHFGFPSNFFDEYDFSQENHRGLYCVNRDHQLPKSLSVDSSGLFFIKTAIQFPKLSTAAAMLFGLHASRHLVTLTESQRDAYLSQQDVELTPEQTLGCTETGYIVCRYEGYTLGLGLYFAPKEERPPILRSLFPKYLR